MRPDVAVMDAEMFTAERQLKAAHEELTAAEADYQAGRERWKSRRDLAERVDRVLAARKAYAAAFAALQKAEGAP